MKVAIIGAGLAGLAAGHKLKRLGHDVTIYEAADRAGGRALRLNRPGTDDWADVGSQYYHSNYKFGLQLIDEVGLTPRLKKVQGKSRIFTEDDDSFMMSPDLPVIKAGGIGGNLSVAAYATKLLLGHQSNTFAAEPKQAVLDARAALDGVKSKFVRDYMVRMLSLIGGLSEPSATNVNALQIHRLAKIILLTEYVSLEGGTATLHETLAKAADIKYNSPAKRLIENSGRIAGFELEEGGVVAADHVIVAAQAPRAATLLPAAWDVETGFLSGIEMPPAIIVSFFLDRALEKDVWTYFLPLDHKGPVRFCIDTHEKSPGNTPSGKATLQAWIINPGSAPLLDRSDDEVAQVALQDVRKFLPHIPGCVESFAVTRHREAVPQSSVGHNARALDFLKAVDARAGVSFVGDYLSGGYMESALWAVDRAVQRFINGDICAPEKGGSPSSSLAA